MEAPDVHSKLGFRELILQQSCKAGDTVAIVGRVDEPSLSNLNCSLLYRELHMRFISDLLRSGLLRPEQGTCGKKPLELSIFQEFFVSLCTSV